MRPSSADFLDDRRETWGLRRRATFRWVCSVACGVCGGPTIRYGKTSSGTQRWRCKRCGATRTNRIDNAAKLLAAFLAWLFSKERQLDMPGGGRTLRGRTRPFWEVWPIAPQTGEPCDVLFLDGIHLARNVVVPMAASEDHVVARYIAQSENPRAWAALMGPIRKEVLLTYLGPVLTGEPGALPAHDSRIEGGVDAQLRAMLREHRGLSLPRRSEAVFWWCHMHTEHPLPAAEILKAMPTDADIAEPYAKLAWQPQKREGPAEWGDGLVWAELHLQDAWRTDWDQASFGPATNTFCPITPNRPSCARWTARSASEPSFAQK